MFAMSYEFPREVRALIDSRARVGLSGAARVLLAALVGASVLSGVAATQPGTVAAAAISPLPVPLFYQNKGPWSGDQLGSCSTTMAKDGCAATSLAMIWAYFGMVLSASPGGTGMDPRIVNSWLSKPKNRYSSGCLMDWASRGFSAEKSVNQTTILNELNAGRPVLLKVHKSGIPMHFVVVTGWNGSNYVVNNPDKDNQGSLESRGYVIDAMRTVNVGVILGVTDPGKTMAFTVDDSTSAFTISGNAGVSATVGYAAGLHWATTVNSLPNGQPSTHADWSATIPTAGNWKVYVWVARAYTTAATAYYSVHSGSSQATVTISQLAYSDQWIPLGTFYYSAGQVATVSLSNVTGHTGDQIAYDAVKWVL